MKAKQIRKLRRKIQHYILIDTRKKDTAYFMYGLDILDAYKRLFRKKLDKSTYPELILDCNYGGGKPKFVIVSTKGKDFSEWW